MRINCKWVAIKQSQEVILEKLITSCKIIYGVSKEEYTPETLLQLGFDENQSMFLFEKDDIEGIILVNTQKNRNWHLMVMAISEHLQNLGFGSIALNLLISSARFKGAESIDLDVRVDNIRGRDFYQKHGFEIERIRKGLYHELDGFRMSMKL